MAHRLALGEGNHELEPQVSNVFIDAGTCDAEGRRQQRVDVRAQEARIGAGNVNEAREALVRVGHVAGAESLVQNGEAGRKQPLESLLLCAMLFLDHVRNNAGHRLEARHAHGHGMRGAQGLREDGLQMFEERCDGFGAHLQGERTENIKPELLVPRVFFDAQLEDEREQLGPAPCQCTRRQAWGGCWEAQPAPGVGGRGYRWLRQYSRAW
jgi:hypothetical protein